MKRNRCQAEAPSMVAASWREADPVCSPASKVIAMNGTPRQILAKITDQRAVHGSPRKSMFVEIKCSFFSDQEMMENWLSNSHQKAIAESTVDTMNGIKQTPRRIALNA